MPMDNLSDLHRFLVDSRSYFSTDAAIGKQQLPTRQGQEWSKRPAVNSADLLPLPEWNPLEVWRRHIRAGR